MNRNDGNRNDGNRDDGNRDDQIAREDRPGGDQADVGSARFQPISDRDLTAFPARDPECLGVRGMLRDHCDGELRATEASRVDDHVHGCRDCALALSRMELEVLRLRQAFADEAIPDVPPDFTSAVLAKLGRVVLEDDVVLDGGIGPDTDGDEPSPLFTRHVMDRVRLEYRGGPRWQRRIRKHGWAAAAAAVIVAAVLLSRIVGDDVVEIRQFEVAQAREAWLVYPDGSRDDLRARQRLAAGTEVRTGRDGSAGLELLDGSVTNDPVDRPAAAVREPTRVDLDPSTACLTLDGGGLQLESGTAWIEAPESWALAVAGGSQVQFQDGAALVTVDPVRRHDGSVLGAARVHRVRVEVLAGRARISRGGMEPVIVRAGQAARYDGVSVIEVDAAPTAGLLARSATAGRTPAVGGGPAGPEIVADGSRSWTGRVIDATTGRGVRSAAVELRIGDEVERATTNAAGWFDFDAAPGSVAIVRVVPPRDSEFASFGPDPMALESIRNAPQQLTAIALAPDVPVRGVVRRVDGRRIAGATIVPCVVDQVFGVIERLDSLVASSDEDGGFELRRLPTDLPRHQVLALLFEKEGLPRYARVDLGARRDVSLVASLDVEMPDPRTVTVAGFEPGKAVRVLREIPGLPLTAWAEEHRAVAGADGRVLLDAVGPGGLWALGDFGDARCLVAAASAGGREMTLGANEISRAALARLHSESRPIDGPTGPIGHVASGARFEIAAAAGGIGMRHLSVRDASRSILPRSQLFLETADGRLTFLGDYDGATGLAFDAPVDGSYRIVAIAEDGSVGVIDSESLDANEGAVTIEAPGAVEVAATLAIDLGAGSLIAFDILDGPLAGTRIWREVDVSSGYRVDGLPAGNYEVTLPNGSRFPCSVRSEQTTSLK